MALRGGVVVEMGCGNGRDLIELAHEFPDLQFIGLDLQEQAVAAGRLKAVEYSVKNIRFYCGDVLDFLSRTEIQIDIFCVCASLIYLDDVELRTLFKSLVRKKVGRIAFCEITSKSNSTIKTHLYVHPFGALLGEVAPGYIHIQNYFSYAAWEVADYQGAMHFVTDRSERSSMAGSLAGLQQTSSESRLLHS